MEKTLIGRQNEAEVLKRCHDSGHSEFVAVYGRRRVGKTFLVRQTLGDKFTFYATGIYNGSQEEQLANFAEQMRTCFGAELPQPTDWHDAFRQLRHCIEQSTAERKVLFLDELPWMETVRSKFIPALELFWNGWASGRDDIMLVVCGSATSWMQNKLIYAKGGLHNRLTQRIHLRPFCLRETEEYLLAAGMEWSRYEIAECYMILGGIPYYLSKLLPSLSMNQNIDNLFFSAAPVLEDEYDMLYNALFAKPEKYTRLVEALYAAPEGLTREELTASVKMAGGGSFTQTLCNLETSGIVTAFPVFGKRKKEMIYKLTDFYTHFYLRFVKGNRGRDHHFWSNMLDNPRRNNWVGHAFERLCQYHSDEIKHKLGVMGVLTDISSWRGNEDGQRYQIDMVIDRRDRVITLCEMKFSVNTYSITADYEQLLRKRTEAFRSATKTRKSVAWAFVTTYGVARNKHSALVHNEVLLENLFEKV